MEQLINSRIEATATLNEKYRKELDERNRELGELVALHNEIKVGLVGKRISTTRRKPEVIGMIKSQTTYEWTLEEIDEHDDVICSDFSDTLDRYREYIGKSGYAVGLVRDVYTNIDAGINADHPDRQWAYFDENGQFPEQFDGGAKVPQKYLKEAIK
jgi:hypothetical protein